MTTRALLVPLLTIAVGIAILAAGLANVDYYVSHAVESARGGDRSGLSWYLPILYLGLGGVGAGVLFLVAGIGVGRGSALCARLCRYALVFISLIALVLAGLFYVSDRLALQEREARIAQAAECERVMTDMQRVRWLDVREEPGGAIAVEVATCGGLAGSFHKNGV